MNNRSPYKVTQTVEMDSIALKNALFDAEKTFKNLSSSSLFNQVQTMLDEIKRLNDIKDKLEMSNFLLYVELERKDLVLAGYIEEIERYRMTLLKKDRDHTKELENIRDQEKEKVKRALQDELNSIESRNKAERMKLNSDIKDLQEDLFRKQRELDITTLNNKKALDEITRLKLNIQDLSNSLNDAENRRQKDLLKLKSDNQAALNDITIKANADKEIWKNNFNDEKNNELNRLRDGYDDYIADLNKKREGELQRLRYNEDQNIMKLRENDSVITGLQSALAAKNKEISDLKNQIEDANYNHNRLIEEQEQEMKKEIADCVNARDREWRDKISIEISVKDKDLKNKDNQIESLNNKSDNLVWQLGEKQKQNEDLINQVNEMNQKLDEAEKRLNEKTRIIEETYSVQITKSNQEIENLLNQLKELHLICKNNQEQNRLAVENLNNDIDLYKQENDRLKNLSEERRRQIDEWKQQYKDYVTYDE